MALPRKDLLKYGLLTVCVILGGVLVYRYATGQTSAEQAKNKAEAEEVKKLEDQRPGSSQEIAKILGEQKELAAQNMLSPTPTDGTLTDTGAGDAAPNTTEAQLQAEQARLDAELAAQAEKERQQLAIRSSKMNAWEDSFGSILGGLGGGSIIKTSSSDGGEIVDRDGVILKEQNNDKNSDVLAQYAAAAGLGNPATATNALLGNKNQAWLDAQRSPSATYPILATKAFDTKYLLNEGTVIPAVLLNAVDAELPGELMAIVSRDVYDSTYLRNRLIPKGTRLIGMYNSEVNAGQERLLIGFSRMIFPNGNGVQLVDGSGRNTMRAYDRIGRSGVPAMVDNRFWTVFGSSLVIGVVSNFTAPLTNLFLAKKLASNSNVTVELGTAASDTANGVLTETSRKILERYQNIKPSVRMREGETFNLVLSRDMFLPPTVQ